MALSIQRISSLSHSSIFETRFPILFSKQLFYIGRKRIQQSTKHYQYCGFYCRRYCVNKSSESDVNSADQKDFNGEENHQGESLTATDGGRNLLIGAGDFLTIPELTIGISATRIFSRLKRYGISGVLAYGLLNTAYYFSTFLFVWLFVAPAPGRMGFPGAAERLLKVLAMVWAGSQVTKLVRAGGALALAPFVDQGLSWFTLKLKFESRGKAFTVIAASCLGLAFMVFFILTLLWS